MARGHHGAGQRHALKGNRMIKLEKVTKIYNGGKSNETTALVNISLEIRRHETVVFKGPSGSGKTTLLSLIGCMARPTAGRIFLDAKEITSLPERFLSQIRRKTFGFVFQRFNLIHGFSALENVILPAYPTGEKRSSVVRRAKDILAMLDMEKKVDAKIEWLSGGEAQRVAIARALINDPAIIIADEPTAHLDAGLTREFLLLMDILRKEGKTLLIASHDPLVYESFLASRVIEVNNSGEEYKP
jgi:putative ABC transport system ATP-binding protein